MTSSRRLILMRHAKAAPYAPNDHDRPLTDQGVRSAADAGRHLADVGLTPDHVVVSSATRAQDTWATVAAAAWPGQVASIEVDVDDAVFSGSADVVLDALRSVPEQTRVLMFVGHNPSVAFLAGQLDDGDGDPETIQAMLHGFPAGAVAVYDVEVPWAELAEETARVRDFYVGRG